MVRNCCGGNTFMPEVYTRVLASDQQGSGSWKFDSWQPNAVVINLGTNDHLNANTPGEIEKQYEDTYVDFVRNISTWYQSSEPTFFLACGPMSEAYCPYVKNVILRLKNEKISTFFLDQVGFPNNCCGHPDEEADTAIAERTSSFIADKMQWN